MRQRSYRLLELHQRIDTQIVKEQRQRTPDALRLQRLKRLKLVIKDRIWGLVQSKLPKIA